MPCCPRVSPCIITYEHLDAVIWRLAAASSVPASEIRKGFCREYKVVRPFGASDQDRYILTVLSAPLKYLKVVTKTKLRRE